jgi:quinol monooxygenase YgiN
MATDPTNPPLLSSFSAHVTLTIAPANIPAFLAALKPAYDAVIAEPENVFFQILQHPQKPGVFRFIETWDMSVEKFMTVSSTRLLKDCVEDVRSDGGGTRRRWCEDGLIV